MKKFLIVLMALILLIALVACGKEAPPSVEADLNKMPADLVAFINEEMIAIQNISEIISGEWADNIQS